MPSPPLGVAHGPVVGGFLGGVDFHRHEWEPGIQPRRDLVDLGWRPPVPLGVPEVVVRLVDRGDRVPGGDVVPLQPRP
ncbi:hypothetical protein ACGF3G_00325 [Streptomyces sp. NPDC048179]|uniref:hypothetical protein n=1 Tax=Streptomyces sp. NPDC048179 TaxID=3365506 RepID=UPI00371063F8